MTIVIVSFFIIPAELLKFHMCRIEPELEQGLVYANFGVTTITKQSGILELTHFTPFF